MLPNTLEVVKISSKKPLKISPKIRTKKPAVDPTVDNSESLNDLFRNVLSGILFGPISSSGHIEFFV